MTQDPGSGRPAPDGRWRHARRVALGVGTAASLLVLSATAQAADPPGLAGSAPPADATARQAGSTPAPVGARPTGVARGARAALPAARPRWATAQAADGLVDRDQQITVVVSLPWNHADGLRQTIEAVSTPSSPQYGRYLTPAQFRRRFGPDLAVRRRVRQWLQDSGLTVDGSSASGSRIVAHGSATVVERAFATRLNTYRVQGRTRRAPTATPTAPADVAPAIDAVEGLDDSQATPGATGAAAPTATRPGKPAGGRQQVPPPAIFRNARPCADYWAQQTAADVPPAFGAQQPLVTCGYTASQIRSAYGLAGGDDGSGQAVAIVDAWASSTIAQDTDTWSRRHGVAPLAAGQLDQSLTPARAYTARAADLELASSWTGEETLDVQAVHGVAPKARIVYAGALSPSDRDLNNALSDVIESGKARIASNSYGEPETATSPASRAAFDAIAAEAAATGVGLYFSSGDDGDEIANTGTRTADSSASSPLVTAVGGTSLGVGAQGQYLFETAWGIGVSPLSADRTTWSPAPGSPESYQSGAGGGTSAVYGQPPYQRGIVPAAIATQYPGAGAPHRAVPDVGALADPNTGYLVGQTQTAPDGSVVYDEYRIGGTSLASPLLAAIVATADQRRSAAGRPPVGFANPALYALPAATLHDVDDSSQPQRAVVRIDYANGADDGDGLITSLRTFGQVGTLTSAPGYDTTTGRGSPNGQAFLGALATIGR